MRIAPMNVGVMQTGPHLQWKLNKLLEYMDNVVTQHKPYDYIQNSFKTIVQEPFTTIDSQGIKNINPKLTPYLTYEKG